MILEVHQLTMLGMWDKDPRSPGYPQGSSEGGVVPGEISENMTHIPCVSKEKRYILTVIEEYRPESRNNKIHMKSIPRRDRLASMLDSGGVG